MRGWRRALAGALLLLLGACSPYSYSKEIAKLSDGVDSLSDSFAASFDGLQADRVAHAQLEILDGHAKGGKIDMAPSCTSSEIDSKADPCLLYARGTSPPVLARAEKMRPRTMAALKALKDYTNALKAVTNAADRDAYDAAVGQLAGAVSTVASTANGAPPGASAAVSASINVFGWLVGTALDQQRYESLKRAVTDIGLPLPKDKPPYPEPSPFRRVANALGDGLDAIRLDRLHLVQREVRLLVNGLNLRQWADDAYRKRLADAQSALAAANALRRADPVGTAQELAKAHDKLVKAVEDPQNDYAAFMKAVGDFAEKASAMEAALRALSPGAAAQKGK
jgi:hypothetical protein